MFSNKYRDQKVRIGEIYLFERWLDPFSLTNLMKSMDRVKNPVLSLPLIGQSATSERNTPITQTQLMRNKNDTKLIMLIDRAQHVVDNAAIEENSKPT